MPSINLWKNFLANKKGVQIVVILLLVVGGIITLDQVAQPQDNRSRAAGDCTVTAAQLQIKPSEQQLFDTINNYRVSKGLAKLTWNEPLHRSAAWMTHDMFTHQSVSHQDSLGRTPDTRLFDCGVARTNVFGEDVVSGANSAAEIFLGWKIDPPDSDNMLNPSFTLGAIAEEVDSTGEIAMWTYNAAGPNGTAVTPITQPTNIPVPTATIAVPSPACLGAVCTSIAPTMVTPNPTQFIAPSATTGPSSGPQVSVAVSPRVSGSPVQVSGTPAGGGGGSGGQRRGIIGLFLAFILLIIRFFLSLIGR